MTKKKIDNHHNALACPYCNPRKMVLVECEEIIPACPHCDRHDPVPPIDQATTWSCPACLTSFLEPDYYQRVKVE